MSAPLVTIVTVVFNNEKTIETAIKSVQSQDYKKIEHIIIDGNSTDKTMNIVNKHKSVLSKIISETDEGIYDALNKGITIANGEIIFFLHSDDIFKSKSVVSKVVKEFSNNNADIVYGDIEYINNKNKLIRIWKAGQYSLKKLRYGWMPPHTSFFVRKKIYELEKLQFKTKYKISADYDLIISILLLEKYKVFYLEEILVSMRLGGKSNKSFKNLLIKTYEDIKIIQNQKVGGFYTVLFKNLRKLNQFLIKK